MSNISLRKSDIGRHTVAVGLFASVLSDAHSAGLSELLKLRAQLLQQPVTAVEVNAYRATLQKVLRQQKSKTTLPESFGDVLQTVSDNFFADKPIRTPAENAKIAEPFLNQISADDVNQKIAQWLNAVDRLVQMQAPSLMPIALPSNDAVAAEAQRAEQTKQPALLAKREHGKGEFVDTSQTGKIVAEQYNSSLHITRWTLQNGDKVIVLQNPVAKDKVYWQAVGAAGFMQPAQNPWQTQLASQIIWQSAPQGWTAEQLNAWKTQHKLSLSHDVSTNKTKLSGSANAKNTADLLHLYHAYLATPQLYSFSQILWRLSGTHTFNLFGSDYTISGYLVWVVIIYAVLGTVFTQVIGHRLHALNYAQQKFEADFRASLVRKHDNAEQIALYNGEQREISSLHGEFGSIIKNWKTIMNAELRLGLFTTGYDRFSLMLPVLASVPLIIAKVLTLGSLMQIRNAFSAVFNSISLFVFAYSILPEWSATIQRLSQFRHSITQEQARDKAAQAGEGLQMTGLNLYTPQGEPILQNVHAHIAPRKWTQLAGQSGLGKSTLLRTIGGLWVDYDGEWQRPHGSSLLLPQKAYLGKGTLAEILSYPRAINPNADYAAVLHDIGLPKYTEQLHETNINWAQTLSAGEQQRIAIARALLAAPDYLYLDENTSALDLPTARHLLQLLKNRLPNSTVVIVSHQSELNDLFDEVLDLSAFRAK